MKGKNLQKILAIIFTSIVLFGNTQEIEKKMTYLISFKPKFGPEVNTDSISYLYKNNTWIIQRSQKEIEFIYFSQDSIIERYYENHPLKSKSNRFLKNKIKREKGKRRWNNYTVYDRKEVTGFIENQNMIWIHSPRSNYFANCQVAPLIEIQKEKLELDGSWNSLLLIGKGYPNNQEFVGKLESKYSVIAKKEMLIEDTNIEFWEIKAVGTHSKLGTSTTTFLYNEIFGIASIEFNFYDGSSIVLTLKN